MLGRNNIRMEQLEAENRTLRAELLAQDQRVDALSRIILTLQHQREAQEAQVAQLAAVAYVATQHVRAAHGFDIEQSVTDRFVWN